MKHVYSPFDNDETVRTQVTLTKSLKEKIEKRAAAVNESLSEYIRKAAWRYIMWEDRDKNELKKLADSVVGLVDLNDHPEWKNEKSVNSYIKNIRSEWK